MGLFGGGSDKGSTKDDRDGALNREVARLDGLPLSVVAQEVLTRGFGPGGPGSGKATHVYALTDALVPSGRSLRTDPAVYDSLARIVAEAVQVLEHEGFVYWELFKHAKPELRLTRAGESRLATG
jgi:hypothetical protein